MLISIEICKMVEKIWWPWTYWNTRSKEVITKMMITFTNMINRHTNRKVELILNPYICSSFKTNWSNKSVGYFLNSKSYKGMILWGTINFNFLTNSFFIVDIFYLYTIYFNFRSSLLFIYSPFFNPFFFFSNRVGSTINLLAGVSRN